MTESALTNTVGALTRPAGLRGIVADWSSDQRAFKNVSWGKAMMWIFLLSDTFIFSCFLLSYMTVRMSTTVPWPNPSEVFALTIGGTTIPLILIAIMTFILISSSGTMAMAVNFGYRHDRVKSAALMLVTAAFGATFVGMQGFEWTKVTMEQAAAHVEGQQHPIKLYLVVWGWLFVLSTCSYLVDYFGLHGYLRWSLILLFMILKAGLIVAIFMHMAWERLALMYAILVPPVLVLVFVTIMVFESEYTHLIRVLSFTSPT